MSRLDIVVFGASGYTGKFLVRELASSSAKEKVTWGVAGRSRQKLQDLLSQVSSEKNVDLSGVQVIEVDVGNAESVRNMCEKAKIVLNCVGPYRFYGEQVVKECVTAGTHHLDVSGEPEFLEKMQLNYDQEAKEKRVYIIGSCGFDSVPADLGVVFTQKSFSYDLNQIEGFMTLDFPSTYRFNYATWESAVYGFASSKNLSAIRKKLFTTTLPKPDSPLPKRTNLFGYFYDDLLKKYCFEFMGSDKSVVKRTQYFNYANLNQRAVYYSPYFTISSFTNVIFTIIFGLTFGLLANFKFGRSLLLNYHRFFSFGLASKLESPVQDMEQANFKIQFRGQGFSEKYTEKDEKHKEKPDQLIITEVSGPEPGYYSTSKLIISCALTILQERDKIPVDGGVLTPGAAFANTNLIERLRLNGFKFDVVYCGENARDTSKHNNSDNRVHPNPNIENNFKKLD